MMILRKLQVLEKNIQDCKEEIERLVNNPNPHDVHYQIELHSTIDLLVILSSAQKRALEKVGVL